MVPAAMFNPWQTPFCSAMFASYFEPHHVGSLSKPLPTHLRQISPSWHWKIASFGDP
jgi:hypothetical protein